jgi:hypothetical protein
MSSTFIIKSFAASLLSLLILASPMRAQGVLAGSGEVAGNIGFNNLTGVDGNKHVEYGFSGAYNLTPKLAVVGEFNDIPQGSLTEIEDGVSATATAYYRLYGGAVRYSFTSGRVAPFIVFGGGYSSVGANATATNANGNSAHASASVSGEYVSVGVGESVYLNQNWGVRPEFRWDEQIYTESGESTTQSDVRGLLSVFFQWGGKQSSKK